MSENLVFSLQWGGGVGLRVTGRLRGRHSLLGKSQEILSVLIDCKEVKENRETYWVEVRNGPSD